jgi:hypothetical protein
VQVPPEHYGYSLKSDFGLRNRACRRGLRIPTRVDARAPSGTSREQQRALSCLPLRDPAMRDPGTEQVFRVHDHATRRSSVHRIFHGKEGVVGSSPTPGSIRNPRYSGGFAFYATAGEAIKTTRVIESSISCISRDLSAGADDLDAYGEAFGITVVSRRTNTATLVRAVDWQRAVRIPAQCCR